MDLELCPAQGLAVVPCTHLSYHHKGRNKGYLLEWNRVRHPPKHAAQLAALRGSLQAKRSLTFDELVERDEKCLAKANARSKRKRETAIASKLRISPQTGCESKPKSAEAYTKTHNVKRYRDLPQTIVLVTKPRRCNCKIAGLSILMLDNSDYTYRHTFMWHYQDPRLSSATRAARQLDMWHYVIHTTHAVTTGVLQHAVILCAYCVLTCRKAASENVLFAR